jgi:transposase
VYGWDTLVLLKHLVESGLSKTAIAVRLSVSRRVIYHWLATGQFERDLEASPPRTAAVRPTKLDRYKPIIAERLATYPELSGTRFFAEMRAAGYAGGITQVREYVARVRPRAEPEPLMRFETPPGHQAQVDFAEFKFPWGKRRHCWTRFGRQRGNRGDSRLSRILSRGCQGESLPERSSWR